MLRKKGVKACRRCVITYVALSREARLLSARPVETVQHPYCGATSLVEMGSHGGCLVCLRARDKHRMSASVPPPFRPFPTPKPLMIVLRYSATARQGWAEGSMRTPETARSSARAFLCTDDSALAKHKAACGVPPMMHRLNTVTIADADARSCEAVRESQGAHLHCRSPGLRHSFLSALRCHSETRVSL